MGRKSQGHARRAWLWLFVFLRALPPAKHFSGKGHTVEHILSIGIDIGTTTTQVVFSRLTLANASRFAVPRIEITEKTVLFASPIVFTPFSAENRLDGRALEEIVAGAYRDAGLKAAEVATGAVIITGQAVRKQNARTVLEHLSGFAGDFVVATAGPDLESVIAGKGSGAWQLSREAGGVVANLDIGGGTTNIVLFQNGAVLSAGCYDIGGRLARIAPDGTLLALEAPAALLAQRAGLPLTPGQTYGPQHYEALAAAMNRCLEEALGFAPLSDTTRQLITPGSTPLALPDAGVAALCFSGGVADCVYAALEGGAAGANADSPYAYGDLGVLLGKAIAHGALMQKARRMPKGETIRATVIGAGSYATTVSGSTIAYTDGLFPFKNLPVAVVSKGAEAALAQGDGEGLARELERFLAENQYNGALIALSGEAGGSYAALKQVAAAIVGTAGRVLAQGQPLLLAVRRDCAKALGQRVLAELRGSRALVCLDEVPLSHGDFIDIGRPLMNGAVVPVVVKTLVFG